MKYREVINDSLSGPKKSIICEIGPDQFISFPAEENNPNYQQYLAWLAEGNEPLPPEGEA